MFGSVFLLIGAPFVGSFLAVVIDRLPAGRSFTRGRSHCDHCGHVLGWRDLIPIVSWLLLRARCRYCGGNLSATYPAIELAALGVALWSVWLLPGATAWIGTAFGWLLLVLAAIDQRTYWLPDVLTLLLALAGLAVSLAGFTGTFLDHLLGMLIGFAALASLAWLYRRWRGRQGLGGGDPKLLGALGAWLGWQALPSVLFLAGVSGLAWCLISAARGRKLAHTTRLPFGPHLCLAGWLVWLYGPLQFG